MDFMARQAQTPWLEFSLQGAHSGEVSDTHQWPYLRNFRSRSSRSSRSSSSCCSRAAVRSTACAPLSPLTCLLRAFTEPGGLTLGERCGERSRLRGAAGRGTAGRARRRVTRRRRRRVTHLPTLPCLCSCSLPSLRTVGCSLLGCGLGGCLRFVSYPRLGTRCLLGCGLGGCPLGCLLSRLQLDHLLVCQMGVGQRVHACMGQHDACMGQHDTWYGREGESM